VRTPAVLIPAAGFHLRGLFFKQGNLTMTDNEQIDPLDELDDYEQIENQLSTDRRRERFPARKPGRRRQTDEFGAGQDDSRRTFKFTYRAARFEEWWLLDSLGGFYEHRWISDVLARVKGGKEASVYLCRSGVGIEAPLVAAKVYRPRSLRNLKNDARYRVGRIDLDEDGHIIKDDRASRAVQKRTDYGETLRHQSWIAYEFQTLEALHDAGADAPRPYAMEKNAILMGYVGELGMAAPTLNAVELERDEARLLFDRVVRNIDLMLTCHRIHGDLSAYNILYWQGDIRLIDFPQVVEPEKNPAAWTIFLRDVSRVCQYFASQGVRTDSRRLAAELWTAHGHRIGKEVHPRDLDADKAEDRQLWDRQRTGR
jgi:RIO kinase 1